MATSLFDFENTASADTPAAKTAAAPLTVFDLTRKIKDNLETNFADFRVVGQVSNLSRAGSGHVYLTLKDEHAQLPAVLWKSVAGKLRFKITAGMEVVCRGRLDVYPPQGKYQMIVSEVEPQGVGSLELAFRQLYEKLAGEGLFDKARKKPLPRFIKTVAVITSPSGAAVRDFLQVLGRRTRQVDVLIVPVRVQGDGAAREMAEAIQTVHQIARKKAIDCIVVTRGGGSVEDLWAFNEEILVRAVAASRIPIVCGVGHEIDVTLCDSAADVRALTPSEAAERIAPEDAELVRNLEMLRRRLEDAVERRLQRYRDKYHHFENHPTLTRPERMIENRNRMVDLCEERLNRALDRRVQGATEKLAQAAAALDARNPLAILARGYTLTETETGLRIRHPDDVSHGQAIRTRLADGMIESIVRKLS